MTSLTLEDFTGAVHDIERTQYHILGRLKRVRDSFADNRIYPHLGRLVKLHNALQTIIERSEWMRTTRNGRVTGINWEEKTLTYEWPELEDKQMEPIEDVIRWAIPHIQDAINEGRTIYEFVEENLEVETVGIVPSYVQEGYLMVPDRTKDQLYVLRYTLSIFRDDGERYRTLKTEHCKTVQQQGVEVHPSTVKLRLVEERRDLPNPATYFFNTDLELPYAETLLPIVKRTLMRHLATEIGEA